ncbi:calreticulin-like [Monodelphis domestica]|uniref:calreticulin-like n=1 Tax=Monodelphis domestica TaxID=13616 RepID=UPI0024E1B0EE|nr:calreticulin-like [Monodelphis domestica]
MRWLPALAAMAALLATSAGVQNEEGPSPRATDNQRVPDSTTDNATTSTTSSSTIDSTTESTTDSIATSFVATEPTSSGRENAVSSATARDDASATAKVLNAEGVSAPTTATATATAGGRTGGGGGGDGPAISPGQHWQEWRRRVYFREEFEDGDGWKKRWVQSKYQSDYGKFKLTAGMFYGNKEKDKGIQTTEDAKFYALSARFKPFSNEGQSLVVQFSVKHEQGIDCGGGYIKLFPEDLDQENMNSNSTYYIMFGPDICGMGNNKVHVILNYKGKNHENNKTIKCRINKDTHLYTLILRPDSTYGVKIDNELVAVGALEDDWDFLPPKKIKDPYARKPRKWDERPQIEDPDDKKPEDWQDFAQIPDPDAKKPDDWDEGMDGKWEPPLIPNLKYKGEWKPRIIDNPDYKGEWVHPEIDNPKYKADPNIYRYYNISVLGLDIWQVKSGSIFDNFLLTNDEEFAEKVGNQTWGVRKDPERIWREAYEAEEKRKQQEETKKKMEAEDEEEKKYAVEEEEDEDEDEDVNQPELEKDKELKEEEENKDKGGNGTPDVDIKDEL